MGALMVGIVCVVGSTVEVGIGEWSYYIDFSLQIQIINAECIKLFTPHLYAEFIGPIAIGSDQFFRCKLIKQQLAV